MKKIIPLFIAISFFSSTFSQYIYPPTKIVDSGDTYFGVAYKDPYRWLEKMEQPEAISWFNKQATYTDSVLNKLNGRDKLIAEWKKLDETLAPFISHLVYEHGRVFYLKLMPGENVGKLYYREGINGKEELLFDPSAYIARKTFSIERIVPSYDGKKIGIAYAEQGAEIGTLKIMMVDTRQFEKDSIYPSLGISSWTFDNKAFLYSSIKSGDSKDAQSRLNAKFKMHVVGNEVTDDADFFSNTSYPALNIAPEMTPYAFLNKDAKDYIFSGIGSTQIELTQFYAPIDQLYSKKIPWKPVCKASDSLIELVYINDDVYAISHFHAKNYKVLVTSLKHPDWANAVVIAPEKPDRTIKSLIHSQNYLLITYSDGINCQLSKYNFTTKTTSEVKLPFSGTIGMHCINRKTDNCILVITSWIKPYTEYSYDAATDILTPGNFNKPLIYPSAYNNLQVEELEVKGHDGTMIPLSVIYKKGMRKDSSNICLLQGYGAYGYSAVPYFDDQLNSLAVQGVIIAIAHVRGGSEKGEAWYRAGFKTSKPNTWRDFISCAEYLIAKGYTSPPKLAGTGTSAGGILISRAVTERPELFAAAICNVGVADAMRNEFTAGGSANIPEFGTVKDSAECKALYEMDGMQHVVNGTKYPAVICVGGWNDARVPAWQPGKFAAALQNASTSGKPILMKVNYDNGHFTENKQVTMANFADQYSFILWQCGDPDFQPKK
jgi:prolyl oligopeptidase